MYTVKVGQLWITCKSCGWLDGRSQSVHKIDKKIYTKLLSLPEMPNIKFFSPQHSLTTHKQAKTACMEFVQSKG